MLASIRHALLLFAALLPSRSRASESPDLVGFNGTGVYNSSDTPASLPWNTYNYCNAPHVNRAHYTPVDSAKLVYVLTVMRHHKRTPDNLFPSERPLNPASGWDCTHIAASNYAGPHGAPLTHAVLNPPDHPFASLLWNGSCDEGQLTRAGFDDARRHGGDWWAVYGGFVRDVRDVWVRTSSEERTFWVASAMLAGMDQALEAGTFEVHYEPSTIDSLVPSYPCPAADALRAAYTASDVPAWNDHLERYAPLAERLGAITGTSGLNAWTSWYDHYFDTLTSRTCHGHPLPCNASTGACVSADDYADVRALGDLEYNYIWNAAQNASTYTSLNFGVFFSELARVFAGVRDGTEGYKARLVVGHDGSMIRLAAGLGLGKLAPLRWPALGSEIVMEVWRSHGNSTSASESFVRVLHEGTPVGAPLDRVPLADFIDLLEAQVPEDVFGACMG